MSTVSPGPQAREPVGARARSTRKWIVMMPGRRVDGVERERPAQDQARVVARPDVDELAGPRAARELRRVVRLEPLARQDLPALDELRRGEPHAHAVRSRPRASSSRRVLGVLGRPSAARRRPSVVVLAVELRGDRRERLGERVGEVAEDVGRVVELDELVGAGQRPPLAARRPRGRPRPGTGRRARATAARRRRRR